MNLCISDICIAAQLRWHFSLELLDMSFTLHGWGAIYCQLRVDLKEEEKTFLQHLSDSPTPVYSPLNI